MASNSWQPREQDSGNIQVSILASEWGSSKGGLSTLNRELALQLAKSAGVKINFFLPKCTEEDREEAINHGISIFEPTTRDGDDELEWLRFPPDHLQIDVVVGHGVKLGRQAQVIRDNYKCKWVQVVHTDPEELGMFKSYEKGISRGEVKLAHEVKLCQSADFVVAVGPKLTEAYRKYLCWCKQVQDVFEFTPGVFSDFASVEQVPEERKHRSVLVFGRGDAEDFTLKGFDIAGRSVAALPDTNLVFVGAPDGKHEEIANRFTELGVPEKRLKVRRYINSREDLKRQLSEVDLVIMPSRAEGFGLTGLEALSAGLPVIVSKNSGFGEALGKITFGSGFVIDSEDPSSWEAAIKGIWNKDKETRLDEAEFLRRYYGERYSWRDQCNSLLEKIGTLVYGTSSKPQIDNEDLKGIASTDNSGGSLGYKNRSYSLPLLRITEMEKGTENQEDASSCHERSTRKRTKSLSSVFDRVSGVLQRRIRGTPCPSDVKERMRQFCEKREGVVFISVPWCENFSFQIEKIYTRLRMVAKEKTRGIVTEYLTSMTSIFTPHEDCKSPRIILIEGEPGMGKTTYCQKLAYDWATKQKQKLQKFPKIDVLLLLRCRDIHDSIWESIDDQILKNLEETSPETKDLFFKFMQDNPSKVLLVLDGLDEADPHKLGVYLSLIQKKQLPGCYIVLTSRHEAGNRVAPYVDTLLEIVGFGKANADHFIRKYFKHKEHLGEKLILQLSDDEQGMNDLKKLTRNPLNALLLCVIFENLNGALPSNRTKLYIEIVLFILRRYELKNGLESSGRDLLLVYNEELMRIGKMAFNSLCEGKLHFEDHEGDLNGGFLKKLGFLSTQVGGSKRAPYVYYGFFHKSFQEFFSAFFLAFFIIEQGQNCSSVLADERFSNQLRQVFTFMSGIIALQSEENAVSIVQSIASLVNSEGRKSTKFKSHLTLAFNFINECKTCRENLYTKLVSTFGKSLNLVVMDLNNFMDSLDNRCIIATCSTFSEVLITNSSVAKLILNRNFIGDKGACSLSKALMVNKFLFILELSCNSIGDEGATSLSKALTVNTSLTTLDLSRNLIGDKGSNSIFKALRENIKSSLTHLDLSSNNIGDEGAYFLCSTLSEKNSLSTLNLSYNTISAEGAITLSKANRIASFPIILHNT